MSKYETFRAISTTCLHQVIHAHSKLEPNTCISGPVKCSTLPNTFAYKERCIHAEKKWRKPILFSGHWKRRAAFVAVITQVSPRLTMMFVCRCIMRDGVHKKLWCNCDQLNCISTTVVYDSPGARLFSLESFLEALAHISRLQTWGLHSRTEFAYNVQAFI